MNSSRPLANSDCCHCQVNCNIAELTPRQPLLCLVTVLKHELSGEAWAVDKEGGMTLAGVSLATLSAYVETGMCIGFGPIRSF